MSHLKFLIPVLLFLIVFSSCQSSKEIIREELPSACTDELFLTLQKRDSSTYTEFEKTYFIKKQTECRDALIKAADKKEHDRKQQTGEKIVEYVLIAGAIFGALVLVIVLGGLGKQ
ncbi:MAG: hypothetical protein JSS63_13880 [Bacteroidetes bacterium]|nr:hypothetical protein [Bacteroidota bacterium]